MSDKIKFRIVKEEKLVTVGKALLLATKENGIFSYDPMGMYNESSPNFVVDCLRQLQEKGLIDYWEIKEGALPEIPYVAGTIY